MNKEQLVALGLTEEQADKVIAGYGTMIPKSRFDEVNEAKKELDKQISERDTQLNDLKKQVKDNEELTTQIQELQNANKQTKTDFEQKLKDAQINGAIKLALAGKVQDVDIVTSLLDREKVELKEDGSLKGGLDEQIKTLQESKPFLFVGEEAAPKPKGATPKDGKPKDGQAETSIGSTFAQEANEKGSTGNAPTLWG